MSEKREIKRTKVISFYSYRGGTGKSTISSNMAKIISKKHKTILIDLDLYSPQLRYIFDIENSYYINDYFHFYLFQTKKTTRKILEPSDLICKTSFDNLDIILSNPKITVSDKTILHDVAVMKRIFPCIQQLTEILKAEYEYILFDCPGELNFYTLNAIAVSDRSIGVIMPTRANVEGTIELVKIFNESLKSKIADIILTMVSTRPSKRKNDKLEQWENEFNKLGIENILHFYYSENIAYRHQFEDDFFYLSEEAEYKKLNDYINSFIK